MEKYFNSKILLFGEYSIIAQSMALAIPFSAYRGKLQLNPNQQNPLKQELYKFAEYIRGHAFLHILLDHEKFSSEIEQGLTFFSSIPLGRGLGSSGALCAAIFHRYQRKVEDRSMSSLALKNIFAQMESHFHGKSSGMDPLVSYSDCPMLLLNAQEVGPVTLSPFHHQAGRFFLLDTQIPRKTELLVPLFLQWMQQTEFKEMCQLQLIPTVNGCIAAFLQKDGAQLQEKFHRLSSLQMRYFLPMIPAPLHQIWQQGLEDGTTLLKLCGAGGGGLLLGMSFDQAQTQQDLAGWPLQFI